MKTFGPNTFHTKQKDWLTRKQWVRQGRKVIEGSKPVGTMSGAHGSTTRHEYFSILQTEPLAPDDAEEQVKGELTRCVN